MNASAMTMTLGVCAFGLVSGLWGAHEVSSVPELVAALEAVNGGAADAVVRLAPGHYDVSACAVDAKGCLSIQRRVAVEGADATSWRASADRNTKVVLDAKYARSVFNVDPAVPNVQFRNLTIQNGTNTNAKLEDGAGAGIQHGWYKGVYATASNCVFRGNMGEGQGGAGHMLNAVDCYFTDNVAREGGAILAAQIVRDCLFERNRAIDNGGAVRGIGRAERCTFVGNAVVGWGGGGAAYGGLWTAEACLCVSNEAAYGGAFGSDAPQQGLSVTFGDVACLYETDNLFCPPTHPDFDAQNPYALAGASPARNAGAALDWEADARDLVGAPRVFLKDGVGRVDIGCYEYSRVPRGTAILLR